MNTLSRTRLARARVASRSSVALVVNCSAPQRRRSEDDHYNLGAAKLADWLESRGYDVTRGEPKDAAGERIHRYDLICLSVIFSWDVPIAREIANRAKGHADVWCGGPGMSALAGWWKAETGLECTVGLDPRFERQRGDYRRCFATRGCPVGCSFCIVPKIEGRDFTFDWDFRPAPILSDNNLSATPIDFQEHIIRSYAHAGVRLAKAESGFEPRTFDADTFARWRPLMRQADAWRFAFDEQREAADVYRMMHVMRSVSPRRKQVYVLIGNEPFASCLERARNVIDWGGEPYVQPVMRLNVLDKREKWVRHDWSQQSLRDFARYFNRHLWRGDKLPLEDYRPRQDEPPPFRRVRGALEVAA
jgi:pyruvate-formate lyase-activating enzyme